VLFVPKELIVVRLNDGRTPFFTQIAFYFSVLVTLCTGGDVFAARQAVTPGEELLPDTTCLYLSIPSAQAFRDSFTKTDLGELVADPVMKPFAEDLANQLRSRFGETQLQLGLNWDDVEAVASGEVCFAQMQPGKEKGAHASVLLVDVTNQDNEVKKLLGSIDATMTKRKATKTNVRVGTHQVTQYELPKKPAQLKAQKVLLTVDGAQLIICSHLQTIGGILNCRDSGEPGSLVADPIYQQVMTELATKSGSLKPQLRWFIDPFVAADVIRAARGERQKRRGKPMISILRDQGFDAIRAAGGHVNLATEEHEVLHRTYVYAPPQVPGRERYKGAARMLSFPASSHLPLLSWIPRELATFTSLNWEILNGFNYATSLVDEIVDSEDFVDAVLDSFKTDKSGPMIDIRAELLAFADDHIVIFSDFDLPIQTDSERILVGIRIKDRKQVEKALEKLWKADAQAEKIQIGDHVVWQIIPEEDEDVPDLILGAPGIPGLNDSDDASEGDIKLPNAAMTVAQNGDEPPYLLVATQIELLRKVLQKQPALAQLGAAADFRFVHQKLEALGAGNDSLLFFSRTDEEFRSAYELIKHGKMPQAESMLGKVLNRLLGPEEKNVIRKQEIDGKNLPNYQVVRRYLGPSGLFITPTDTGWFVTGVMVSKQKLVDKQDAARANLTTASVK